MTTGPSSTRWRATFASARRVPRVRGRCTRSAKGRQGCGVPTWCGWTRQRRLFGSTKRSTQQDSTEDDSQEGLDQLAWPSLGLDRQPALGLLVVVVEVGTTDGPGVVVSRL